MVDQQVSRFPPDKLTHSPSIIPEIGEKKNLSSLPLNTTLSGYERLRRPCIREN